MQISIISTVCYKNKSHFIYKRALELIEYFKKTNYEFIIADASKNKILKSNYSNIKIIQINYHNPFSPAYARNTAIKKATFNFVMFYDIDMVNSEEFFMKIENKIKEEMIVKNKNFILLPFLYLSKKGTKVFDNYKNLNTLKESYLKGSRELVESISLNSSAMVIKKTYLEKIGLFDISFKGHGGEDFELIHRLIANNPHSKQPDDYYINETSNIISKLKGFRKYMAYYTLPLFFEDLFLVHRWHDRPLFNNFYLKKLNNQDLLVSKMKEYDEKNDNIWKEEKELLEFELYLKQLCKKYIVKHSIGLYFCDKKYKKNKVTSKLRKLISNPKKFFKDINLLQNKNKYL